MSEIARQINIAIIAHVDHGKTTLTGNLLQQTGSFSEHQDVQITVMDNLAQEKERGITIQAKCCSVDFKDPRDSKLYRINIIDTPGHSDFGGEVERVLSMADIVLLLVDSSEGVMTQTRYVLSKSLKLKLPSIVVINKFDRADERADEVKDEIENLFINLGADDHLLDFPVLYASGRAGWATKKKTDARENLIPLLETIIDTAPVKNYDINAPFSMLTTMLEADNFLGRLLIGKVYSGKIKTNSQIKALNLEGKQVDSGKAVKLFRFKANGKLPVDEAQAGDIIVLAGLSMASVSDTICAPEVTVAIEAQPIDPPTMAITLSVNDSPYAGREGTKVTSRMIGDRLMKEAESNISIKVKQTDNADAYEVGGRGELQLGVLIENMRREGFELSVSRPRVLYRIEEGQKMEPIEEVTIVVNEQYSSTVIDKLNSRKGEMSEMMPFDSERMKIIFHVPTRALVGYQGEFMNDTRGSGVMNKIFHGYAPYKGEIASRRTGVLISTGEGEIVAYALDTLQDRGTLFVSPGDKTYEGMIVGENAKDNDLDVNPLKTKQLSNMRSTGHDEAIKLIPPKKMTLEQYMAYIDDDELVEVTPKNIRLRKKYLSPNERKRFGKR